MKQNLMVFFNTIRFYIVNFMKQNLMVFFNTIRFYFYLVKSDGIEKYQTCGNIYFFFILQCQWHQHGSEVLENTLLILRGWGNTSSSVGFASGGRKYCLNLSGFWGYFPIPPRHADAIVTILTLCLQYWHFIFYPITMGNTWGAYLEIFKV